MLLTKCLMYWAQFWVPYYKNYNSNTWKGTKENNVIEIIEKWWELLSTRKSGGTQLRCMSHRGSTGQTKVLNASVLRWFTFCKRDLPTLIQVRITGLTQTKVVSACCISVRLTWFSRLKSWTEIEWNLSVPFSLSVLKRSFFTSMPKVLVIGGQRAETSRRNRVLCNIDWNGITALCQVLLLLEGLSYQLQTWCTPLHPNTGATFSQFDTTMSFWNAGDIGSFKGSASTGSFRDLALWAKIQPCSLNDFEMYLKVCASFFLKLLWS